MKLKQTLNVLISGVAGSILSFVAVSSPAQALIWTFNNVIFQDGGTATGSFDYNATANTYSVVNINVTGPVFGSTVNFTTANLVTPADSQGFDVINGNKEFNWFTSSNLTNAGGLITLNTSASFYQNKSPVKSSSVVSGFLTAAPIPVPFEVSLNQVVVLAIPLFIFLRMFNKSHI